MAKGTKCLSKTIVSSRRMIMMMQPTTVWTCVTLVACFAGHANAAQVYYERGLCLDAAAGASSCSANDISGIVTNFVGPTNCTFGQMFNYSVGLNITLTSNAARCDLGAYFGLDGENARNATGNASCLVQVLDSNDTTVPGDNAVKNLDVDFCYDVDPPMGGNFKGVITNFAVTDLTTKCSNPTNGNVGIEVCFVWSTCAAGGNVNCTDPISSSCATPPNTTLHNSCLKPNPDNSVSSGSHLLMD